jgi:uncharacterized protein DUF3303
MPAARRKEPGVLFLVTWEFTDASEAGGQRSLGVFQQWKPTTGAEFQGFYGFADNSGGAAIVEVDSHATLARITAPFAPWLRFTAKPLVAIEESAAIAGEAIAWRASLG